MGETQTRKVNQMRKLNLRLNSSVYKIILLALILPVIVCGTPDKPADNKLKSIQKQISKKLARKKMLKRSDIGAFGFWLKEMHKRNHYTDDVFSHLKKVNIREFLKDPVTNYGKHVTIQRKVLNIEVQRKKSNPSLSLTLALLSLDKGDDILYPDVSIVVVCINSSTPGIHRGTNISVSGVVLSLLKFKDATYILMVGKINKI